MTGKQIEKIRKEIPQFENGIPCELTPEQKRLHRELVAHLIACFLFVVK